MGDDELRRHLHAALPPVRDDDVERALLRTRAVADMRARRTRRMVRLAPVAVAAVTAAVIVLVTIGLRGSAGRPTTQPTPGPTGTTTPTAPPTAWFRHVVGVSTRGSGTLDLRSVWVVRLTSPDSGTFDVRPADRFGTGTLRYDGSRGGWVVDVLARWCGTDPGIYRVTRSGDVLVFTVVRDACEPRRDVLDDTVFAPLTSPDQLLG
jgi:hypothetical protein